MSAGLPFLRDDDYEDGENFEIWREEKYTGLRTAVDPDERYQLCRSKYGGDERFFLLLGDRDTSGTAMKRRIKIWKNFVRKMKYQ